MGNSERDDPDFQPQSREIRVFLSSTFRDMQCEREHLIKVVFPELRRKFRERLVELTEVDLRWGIPEQEAQNGHVVSLCLDEIDKSRPYFLCLLGERYGWVPDASALRSKLGETDPLAKPVIQQALAEQKSVTEMEILYGVLEAEPMAKHAFFAFRDPDYLERLLAASEPPLDCIVTTTDGAVDQDVYRSSSAADAAKLQTLKERIRQWERDHAPGHVLEPYTSLDELGAWVKERFMQALEQEYPLGDVPATEEGRRLFAEQLAHDAFAFSRCSLWIRNPADVAALDAFVSGHDPVLLVTGQSGDGKSALLANWAERQRQAHPQMVVFEHYVGAYGESTGAGIRARLLAAIQGKLKDASGATATAATEASAVTEKAQDPFALLGAMGVPVILVLDALNQMPDDEQTLQWLPKELPANTRLLVSALDGKAKTALLQREVKVHEVQPLDKARQRQLIDATLARYSRQLRAEDRQHLLDHPLSNSPLFLKMVLEELRTFGKIQATTGAGVEKAISERLAFYLQAQSLADCFERFLQRLEEDFGKPLVAEFLALMLSAPFGLAESDATVILEPRGHTRLALSALLQHLREHLALRDGRYDFFHDYLRQAAFNRHIQAQEHLKPWRKRLLDHALSLGPEDPVALQDAAALVLRLGEPERTLDFLSAAPWVVQVAMAGKSSVLEDLFLSLDDRQALLARYQAQPMTAEAAAAARIFGRMEQEIGQPAQAKAWFEQALAWISQLHGAASEEVAGVWKEMAVVHFFRDDYPQALVCLDTSLEIHTQLHGAVSEVVAWLWSDMAEVFGSRGLKDYPQALACLDTSLEIFAQLHGAVSEVVAWLWGRLAGVYASDDLKDYPQALACQQKRLEILGQLHGAASEEVAVVLGDMAMVHFFRDDYPQALACHQTSLKIYTQLHGTASKEVAEVWKDMAEIYRRYLKDHPQALACHQKRLEILSQLHGAASKEVAGVLGEMAEVYGYDLKDHPQALDCHQKRLEILSQLHGAASKEVAGVLWYMAEVYGSRGLQDHPQALACQQKRLEILSQLHGAANEEVAWVLGDIGESYSGLKDYPQALDCLEKQLAILIQLHGERSSRVAVLQRKMARIKEKAQRQENNEAVTDPWQSRLSKATEEMQRLLLVFPEAQDLGRDMLLHEARALDEAVQSGSGDAAVLVARIDGLGLDPLGQLLLILAAALPLQRSNREAAKGMLALAASRASTLWDSTSTAMAHFLNNQAWVCRARFGNHKQALACLEKSLEIFTNLHGAANEEVAWVLGEMAEIYGYDLKDHPQALDCHQRRLEIYAKLHGAASEEVAGVLGMMAWVCGSDGLKDYPQALACLEKSLEIFTNLHGAANEEVARVWEDMARVYGPDGLEDYPQALDCQQKRLEIYTQLHGEVSEEVAGVWEEMGDSYSSLKNFPQALRCLEKGLAILTQLRGKNDSAVRRVLKDTASVLSEIAQSHERRAQWVEAENCWRQILGLRPEVAENIQQAREGLFRVLREQGRFAEANAIAAS